jgi:hypothetical protein
MIDGACNNESYPNDFFIDLMFTEAVVDRSDVECKDAFWEAMTKTCKEKQVSLPPKKEKVGLPTHAAPAAAFIIDEKKEDIKVRETEDSNTSTPKVGDEKEVAKVEAKKEDEKEEVQDKETKNEVEEEDVDKLIARLESEVQS